jgi:hypothetical protein
MLQSVLHEIETAGGTVNLADLSHKLNVEPGALAGMLEFWVRKGRLQRDGVPDNTICPPGPVCGGSCPGAATCPFVINMPATFSLVSNHD